MAQKRTKNIERKYKAVAMILQENHRKGVSKLYIGRCFDTAPTSALRSSPALLHHLFELCPWPSQEHRAACRAIISAALSGLQKETTDTST